MNRRPKPELVIDRPQFLLTGDCPAEIHDGLMAYHGCVNSAPWQGHAAGTLYVSKLVIGAESGSSGPFQIGFRKCGPGADTLEHVEPMDFASLPPGEWHALPISQLTNS